MSNTLDKINFDEAAYFYKSPDALVDYSLMQSFSLIKSSIEVLAYYGVREFTPADIRDFFKHIQLVQKKNGRVFIPSPKKVESVLECYTLEGKNCLHYQNGSYFVQSWDCSGYGFELERKQQKANGII